LGVVETNFIRLRTIKGDAYALGDFLPKVLSGHAMCNLFKTDAVKAVFDDYIHWTIRMALIIRARRVLGNDVAFLSAMGLRSGELRASGRHRWWSRARRHEHDRAAHQERRWHMRLQYTWAFYHGWSKCRAASPFAWMDDPTRAGSRLIFAIFLTA